MVNPWCGTVHPGVGTYPGTRAAGAGESRDTLAIQQEEGLVLDNPTAALRTACFPGVATTKLAGGDGNSDDLSVTLTAGDVDEAVTGLLGNRLAASDVDLLQNGSDHRPWDRWTNSACAGAG